MSKNDRRPLKLQRLDYLQNQAADYLWQAVGKNRAQRRAEAKKTKTTMAEPDSRPYRKSEQQ